MFNIWLIRRFYALIKFYQNIFKIPIVSTDVQSLPFDKIAALKFSERLKKVAASNKELPMLLTAYEHLKGRLERYTVQNSLLCNYCTANSK